MINEIRFYDSVSYTIPVFYRIIERERERERRKVGLSFLKKGIAVLDKLLINGVMGHEVEAGGTVEAWKVQERQ